MKTEEQKHTALCLLWSTQHTRYGYRGGQMVSTHQVWTFTDLSARFANSCIVGRKHRPESLFYRNSRNAQCLWGTAEHMELEIRGPPSSPSNRSGSVWSEANTSTTVLFCCIFLPKCVIFNYLNTTLHLQIYSIKNWVTSTHIPSKKKKRHFLKAKRKKSVTSVPCSPLPFVDRAFLMVSNSDITGQGGEAPTPQVLSFSHNQLPQHCLWQLAAGLRAGKRRDQQPLLTSWPCAPIPRLAQLHLSARGTGLSPTSGSSLINTGQNIHVSHSCPSAQPNNITEPQQGSCRHKKLPAMKQGIKYSLQKNTVSVSTCSCKLNPVSTHFELHETTPWIMMRIDFHETRKQTNQELWFQASS